MVLEGVVCLVREVVLVVFYSVVSKEGGINCVVWLWRRRNLFFIGIMRIAIVVRFLILGIRLSFYVIRLLV